MSPSVTACRCRTFPPGSACPRTCMRRTVPISCTGRCAHAHRRHSRSRTTKRIWSTARERCVPDIHAKEDQATGLRRLFVRTATPVGAIAGVDADAAIVALAAACADVGERVLIIDRSRGGVAGQAGLRARHELWHVLEGDVTIDMALLPLAD